MFSLQAYNTFSLNSSIKQENWHVLTNFSEIEKAYYQNYQNHQTYYLLGGGSNIILTKQYFDNTNIYWFANAGIEVIYETSNKVRLEVQAGTNWHDFVRWCVEHEYYGIENLALIPGTVGASPVQNIGAYGVEVKDTIYSVKAFHQGQHFEILNADCEFDYRNSLFKAASGQIPTQNPYWITSVVFELSKEKFLILKYQDLQQKLTQENTILDLYNMVCNIRRHKLPNPLEVGNCGSFFKNPVILKEQLPKNCPFFELSPLSAISATHIKIPAGWLIEQLNIKGHFYQSTSVGIHPQHALVLINDFKNHESIQATINLGQAVVDFSQSIINQVHQRFGILLEREVNLWL